MQYSPHQLAYPSAILPATVLYTGEQTNVAQIALDVINEMSRKQSVAPTSASLAQATVQAEIVRRVQELVTPAQSELLPTDGPSVEDIVKKTVAVVVEHTIDILKLTDFVDTSSSRKKES